MQCGDLRLQRRQTAIGLQPETVDCLQRLIIGGQASIQLRSHRQHRLLHRLVVALVLQCGQPLLEFIQLFGLLTQLQLDNALAELNALKSTELDPGQNVNSKQKQRGVNGNRNNAHTLCLSVALATRHQAAVRAYKVREKRMKKELQEFELYRDVMETAMLRLKGDMQALVDERDAAQREAAKAHTTARKEHSEAAKLRRMLNDMEKEATRSRHGAAGSVARVKAQAKEQQVREAVLRLS